MIRAGARAEWTDPTDVTPIELRSDPPLEISTVPQLVAPAAPRPQIATLLVGCPDQQGIVASLAQLLESHGVRVQETDHHTDPVGRMFFQRIRFDLSTLVTDRVALEGGVREVCERFGMDYRLYGDRKRRVAILVSKQDHCLYDLLVRHRAGELPCEIAMVVSNHPDAAPIAQHFGIPFHHVPVTRARRDRSKRRR